MQETSIARGDLLTLWHPTAPQLFSGYGLAVHPDRKDQLVGLLMIDRPRPAPPEWLAQVEQAFGDYTLYPMTASQERGIACQMRIDDDSLPYVRPLDHPESAQMQSALLPMLIQPPNPSFRVGWNPSECLWTSSFLTNESSMNHQSQGLFTPLFSLGQVVATPGALDALDKASQSPLDFLVRHVRGEWGDLDPHDVLENQRALIHGSRLFSAYNTANGDRLWVITEADRSVTTLLKPSE